jgi:hypothetical protein
MCLHSFPITGGINRNEVVLESKLYHQVCSPEIALYEYVISGVAFGRKPFFYRVQVRNNLFHVRWNIAPDSLKLLRQTLDPFNAKRFPGVSLLVRRKLMVEDEK